MFFMMIMLRMIVMTVLIAVLLMITMISVIIMVVMNMNLAIKVLGFSPHQRRPDRRLDRKGATIAEAPLKNTTKQTIDGVMPGLIFKVVIETTMAFDGDDGREVEFTGFKGFARSTMGAVGFGR